jgi:hypothetical protein
MFDVFLGEDNCFLVVVVKMNREYLCIILMNDGRINMYSSMLITRACV